MSSEVTRPLFSGVRALDRLARFLSPPNVLVRTSVPCTSGVRMPVRIPIVGRCSFKRFQSRANPVRTRGPYINSVACIETGSSGEESHSFNTLNNETVIGTLQLL